MEIYRIINKVNGESYIGKSKNSKVRFRGHIRESRLERYNKRKISCAIRKYGEENFYYEVLEETNDKDRERYWIKFYDTYNNGYNHTKDGEGNKSVNKNPVNKITKEMIKVAEEQYKIRPNLRIASKKSGIPEYRLKDLIVCKKYNINR